MVVKTFFLRWVDLEEMKKVMNQSWFHRIKEWLGSGVTISLPFVTLTFESGVKPEFFSQREVEHTALKLVKNSKPMKYVDYQNVVQNQVKSGIFKPFLIVVEGKVHLVMDTLKVIEVLYDFLKNKIPDKLPIINWHSLNLYDENQIQQIKAQLIYLATSITPWNNIENLLTYEIPKQEGYLKIDYQGIRYNLGILFPPNEEIVEHKLLFPDEAVRTISGDVLLRGLYTRIVGWVVNVRSDIFMIRAIALAEMLLFTI
jgi:hypothetical protein